MANPAFLEQGKTLRINALLLIWRFGWLRPQELGRDIFHLSPSCLKQGESLARKLEKETLVIRRRLPFGAGSALVLSQKGVTLLNASIESKDSKSGKDWGNVKNGEFKPPSTWEHELLANSLIITIKQKNPENYTYAEAEIRRRFKPTDYEGKIPDGLFGIEGDAYYWLEVENKSKTGKEMRKMVEALERVESGNSMEIFGRKPKKIAIGISLDAKDSRNYKINHTYRIEKALSKLIDNEITVTFLIFKMLGHAVVDYEKIIKTIYSDAVLAKIEQARAQEEFLRKLQENELWNENGNMYYQHLLHSPLRMYFYKSDEGWRWEVVESETRNERGGILKKESEPLKSGESSNMKFAKIDVLTAAKALQKSGYK
jgi:hypothetical protein